VISDAALVLPATARVLEEARGLVEAYAGPTSPIRTDQVSLLLARAGCHLEVFPFRSDTVAMTLPRCAGVHPILVNRGAERTDRQFALRHELAHVLAGDTEGPVYLVETGSMTLPERVADLFALSDLVPGWWIADVRRGPTPWRTVCAEITLAIAEYAESWPAERLADRAGLRLRLFRERGV
jgi:hypothetical protein